jgi:hypothetical protein
MENKFDAVKRRMAVVCVSCGGANDERGQPCRAYTASPSHAGCTAQLIENKRRVIRTNK